MGTQLMVRGAVMGGESNLSDPDQVLAIHHDYVRSGCQILMTNTLTMNRVFIETHNLGIDVGEVNMAGAKLARQAIKPEGYVLGNISSTSKLLKPYGDLTDQDAIGAYAEQASILERGEVDGFIIETMMDLKEAQLALQACREVSTLPVIVTISFKTTKKGGRTMMGNKAVDCVSTLVAGGATAVGANCGDVDPWQMAEIISTMRDTTDLPILAKPNAGMPRVVDRQTVYDMSVAEFQKGLRACIEAGATLVGGCCGTTPGHIKGLAEVL